MIPDRQAEGSVSEESNIILFQRYSTEGFKMFSRSHCQSDQVGSYVRELCCPYLTTFIKRDDMPRCIVDHSLEFLYLN